MSNDEPSDIPDDYGSDVNPTMASVDNAFANLDHLVALAKTSDETVAQLERQLAAAKETRRDLYERQIPEQLDAMKMKACTTRSGVPVSVKQVIRASLPSRDDDADRRAKAIRWLIENGHGALIKNAIAVELERGDDDRAEALHAELLGRGITAIASKDVPAQTLGKLVRELLEAGRAVPRDLINVYDQRTAVLK